MHSVGSGPAHRQLVAEGVLASADCRAPVVVLREADGDRKLLVPLSWDLAERLADALRAIKEGSACRLERPVPGNGSWLSCVLIVSAGDARHGARVFYDLSGQPARSVFASPGEAILTAVLRGAPVLAPETLLSPRRAA